MTHERETKLEQAVLLDVEYQRQLAACITLEQEYERIRAYLSEEDRRLLDRYISLCEELDHRRLCIAMSMQ